MSYRKKHIKGKIKKIKPKEPVFKKKWFLFAILFLIIICLGGYFTLFYPGVKVRDIVIYGNQRVAGDDIKKLVLDNANTRILSVGPWGIFSKSIFVVDSDKLAKELENKNLLIEKAQINKKFWRSLIIRVRERIPVAVFCSSKDGCYFIDSKGIIFEPANEIIKNMATMRRAGSDQQPSVGERVVEQNIINFFLNVEKNLKENFQVDIKEALIASPIRFNITTAENWQVYFDLSPDSDESSQIGKLNLLLNGGISGIQRKNLRYIDLRPEDRAVVCDNKNCGG